MTGPDEQVERDVEGSVVWLTHLKAWFAFVYQCLAEEEETAMGIGRTFMQTRTVQCYTLLWGKSLETSIIRDILENI